MLSRIRPLAYVLVVLAAYLVVAGLAPQPAEAAKVPDAEDEGIAIHYFNGDSKVQLSLATDELMAMPEVQTKDARGAVTHIEQLMPGTTASAQTLSADRLLVQFDTPATNLAQVYSRAQELQDAGYTVLPVAYPGGASEREEEYRQVLTSRIALQLQPGDDIAGYIHGYGLSLVEQVDYAEDTYILETLDGDLLKGLNVANALYESGAVRFAVPLIEMTAAPCFIPNDPLFGSQWHLRNTGQLTYGTPGLDIDAEEAWDIATGEGVNVLILDDGVEQTHEDLAANVRPELGLDVVNDDSDPTPLYGDAHGTNVAGLAAAVGNNGIGVTGVAFDASLIGVRLLGNGITTADSAQAFAYLVPGSGDAVANVSSNSWGWIDFVVYLSPLELQAFENGVTNGRDGKGVIYVWAAGNSRLEPDIVNYDQFPSSRYTIGVACSQADGDYAYYSEGGSGILVNAPGDSVYTTDPTVGTIYSYGKYFDEFNGTSAATPIVSGVVALMLEANPDLTWRDVQHVLVDSSTKNDPLDSSWIANGSGRRFSHDYGYGAVNAKQAVDLAKQWVNVPANASPLQASGGGGVINDLSSVTSTVQIAGPASFFTEHVEATINITHTYRGDLEITLTSPSGTESVLAIQRGWDYLDNISNYTFTSVACWGENPSGTWTLKVKDTLGQDSGTLDNWQLKIHGFTPATDAGLSVSPATAFSATGPETGPFSGSTKSYTVTNTTGSPIDFQVLIGQSWLNAVPSSGTIAAGSQETVVIQLTSEAAELPVGAYTENVFFKNTQNGEVVQRLAELVVNQQSNSRPIVSNVSINDSSPSSDTSLLAIHSYFDPNGPTTAATTQYEWYRDGVHVPIYDNINTLPSSATNGNQVWYVRVRAQDIEGLWSTWVPSKSVVVDNAPPSFTNLTNKTVVEEEILDFTVTASDPDQDMLRYAATIVGISEGYYMYEETGRFVWDTYDVAVGNYTAQFSVTDDGVPPATTTQNITITVEQYCPEMTAPTDVKASQGAFTDRIRVTYPAVEGATSYRVYRSSTSDVKAATLIGEWADTTFDDFSAVPPATSQGLSCPSSSSTKRFYYWVASSNGCDSSPKTGPASGYTGSSTTFFKSAQISTAVYEKALPSREIADGILAALPTDELAVRLRAEAPIDPESVWGTVKHASGMENAIVWIPVDARDGWVSYWPGEAFKSGEQVVMTAGARTTNGDTVGPVTYTFSVGPVAEAASTSEQTAGMLMEPALDTSGPPAFAEAVGLPYKVKPEQALTRPQTIMLPVPEGMSAKELRVYYYLANGEDAGWYPADVVDGWMVPGSRQTVDENGATLIGIDVRHTGIVQLGKVSQTSEAAAGFDNRFVDGLIILAVAMSLALASRRRSRTIQTR